MDKQQRLNELYQKYRTVFDDKEIVVGDGNANAKILLIGEAPGKDEVRLAKPFVGMAGKNLNEFLEAINIERTSIYITNAIKYRLSKVNPDTQRVINRPATVEEITTNRQYLMEEVNIINPLYIVTLGNVPLRAVTGDLKISIGDVHGALQRLTIGVSTYSLFPLYHPASIIYNRGLKEVYYHDLEKFKSLLI